MRKHNFSEYFDYYISTGNNASRKSGLILLYSSFCTKTPDSLYPTILLNVDRFEAFTSSPHKISTSLDLFWAKAKGEIKTRTKISNRAFFMCEIYEP